MTATGRPRTSVESRSPLSGSRPLVRLSSGAEPGSALDDRPERAAREGDDDQVGLLERGLGESGRRDVGEIDLGQVARVAAGLANRRRVLAALRGERDRDAAVGEQPREPRSPRAAADDDGAVHERRRKSIVTGTPSRANRARSSFSTQ